MKGDGEEEKRNEKRGWRMSEEERENERKEGKRK